MSDKLRAAFERLICKPKSFSTAKQACDHLAVVEYADPFVEREWLSFQAGHAHAMRGEKVYIVAGETFWGQANAKAAVIEHAKGGRIARIATYIRQEEE